ncbi:rhodanese-like domain-containing protein [Microbacterium sp. EST19A]|uniref:rhodanese-like domain-containing protein n=1 Tax=Microbacterium sp. EST19A TaxID=2862681 RepID=UPI001CBF68B2|nr:rhodanese-like domain-containing protein [Microbacterium sp. EST19A]
MTVRHFFRRPRTVTAIEAIDLIADGAVVVDVRREQEWRRQHVPQAVHIPLGELERRAAELPEDRLLIAFCTGGLLSSGAANLLTEHGFDAVNLGGGLIDWRAAGGALIAEDGSPPGRDQGATG